MIDEKIRIIAEFYGTEHQMNKLIEELSELQIEAVKFLINERFDRDKLIDELADVENMIDEIKYLVCCTTEVKKRREFKIKRQLERISK